MGNTSSHPPKKTAGTEKPVTMSGAIGQNPNQVNNNNTSDTPKFLGETGFGEMNADDVAIISETIFDDLLPPKERELLSQKLTKLFQEANNYQALPYESYIVGLCILRRLADQNFLQGFVKKSGENAFLLCTTAFMLGTKNLEDVPYNNKSWGQLSGRSLTTINNAEKELLKALDYNINVSPEEYANTENIYKQLGPNIRNVKPTT